MLYFSELKHKKVYTEDNVYLGRLSDLVFRATDTPTITKLLIHVGGGEELMVPVVFMKRIQGDYGDVMLHKRYETAELAEDELYIGKNLLDNQIIDISGDKMVRVNDVAIQDKPELTIAGADIGVLGVLRWFGIEDLVNKGLSRFKIKLHSRFLSWADIQTLELTRGHVKIKKEQTKLSKIRPEDLADYLEQTNVDNTRNVVKMLTVERAANVINNLNLNYQLELFRQFDTEEAAKIISHMEEEEAADILSSLPKKKAEKIMSHLPEHAHKGIIYLLDISKSPVGDIISTEYLTVSPDATVREVSEQIKSATQEFSELYYVYVLNKEQQLVGVFSMHELLLQGADASVFKFMSPNVLTISLSTPESVVLKKLLKYKLYALPVVDREKHILGIVTFDDVSELIHNIQ